ncbi:MAG: RNA 2',3'-cyclic phosphodiesterase [Candidatus Zixiibacteriota bacterium]|nr:MAG: RNA 2',3'-cyclic phosphodiesterase [candidate division Zixibacteria bacterium]
MDKIRTFIAVDLPQDAKMEVDKLTSTFRNEGRGIKWVNAENLHITLRFLGDVREEVVPRLAETIKTNIYGFGRFDLSLSGLGGFPNLRMPRVIWVDTYVGKDRLRDLATGVEMACIESKLGRSDKRFTAHLTIGRVKNPSGIDNVLKKIQGTRFETRPFNINAVTIFKSDLSPAGAKYTPLEIIRL